MGVYIMTCEYCRTRLFNSSKYWEKIAKTCHDCRKTVCHAHRRRYVDGSNEAITNNAPTYCLDCFSRHYDKNGDPILARQKQVHETTDYKLRLFLMKQGAIDRLAGWQLDRLVAYVDQLIVEEVAHGRQK